MTTTQPTITQPNPAQPNTTVAKSLPATTPNATAQLIAETCRRFLETCGWPLRFLPRDGTAPTATDQLWRRELGGGSIGELVLDLPDDEALDAEFLQMTKAAELVAGLLDEALAARRAAETSRGEVETLARIGSTVPRLPDLPSALSQLLRAVTQLTGFRSTAFFLLDPGADRLALRLRYEANPTAIPALRRDLVQAPHDLAALAGRTVVLRRSETPSAVAWLAPNMATAACVPVQSEHAPLGTLWVFDRRDRQPEPRELHVLGSIAAQLATLLERAVLVRESASEKSLRRGLRAAGDAQPGQILTEPNQTCGFTSAGVCRSALEIGGDLVTLFPLSETQTLIAIGDASGCGIPAAMVMANVRGAVRLAAHCATFDPNRPDLAVAKVNRALCGITPDHQFMSLLLGVFDSATRTYTYTNAGHPTPLHVRNGAISELQSHGMLLGIVDEADYECSTLQLAAGDMLVLFTDGVSEAMSRNHCMFRCDRIVDAVRSVIDAAPATVVETIWSRLMSHQAGSSESDDRSLLVLRVQ